MLASALTFYSVRVSTVVFNDLSRNTYLISFTKILCLLSQPLAAVRNARMSSFRVNFLNLSKFAVSEYCRNRYIPDGRYLVIPSTKPSYVLNEYQQCCRLRLIQLDLKCSAWCQSVRCILASVQRFKPKY